MVEEQGTDTGINTFASYTESREKGGLRRFIEDGSSDEQCWYMLSLGYFSHSCFLCLHAAQTVGQEGGYNMCFRWGFSYLPPECTTAMFSVC